MKEKFAVSLMCMDFLKVGEQLNILNDWVGMYHVDIMDGHYCKNITLSPDLVKSFKKVSKLPPAAFDRIRAEQYASTQPIFPQ